MTGRHRTLFILNAELVETDLSPKSTLLEYLRDQKHLLGTKNGCNEGGCGACNVLLGEWFNDRVRYQPATSCLLPLGAIAGKHIITIEGLSGASLTAVQAALCDSSAIQCGYCTPGFVVSISGWMLDPKKSTSDADLNDVISGNLCRCTGYRPIKAAVRQLAEQLHDHDTENDRVQLLCDHFGFPRYLLDIEKRLKEISSKPDAGSTARGSDHVIAGATDLYIQDDSQSSTSLVRFLGRDAGVTAVKIIHDDIYLDAGMSFECFIQNPIMQNAIPGLLKYGRQMGSWAVRCRATLGGNLCNASPTADISCLMLILAAEIELQGDKGVRLLPIKELFLGYKKLNKTADEALTTIRILKPGVNTRVNWLKVSKRFTLDIGTVNSAIKIACQDKTISQVNIAFGGVDAIPVLLEGTAEFLMGKVIDHKTILDAVAIAQTEIEPISDVRGSSMYRRLLVRQLIVAHFMHLFPEDINEALMYEAL